MKVNVSQGHERGIGLEVFFKSCMMINQDDLKNIQLFAFEKSVINSLDSMRIPYQIFEKNIFISGIKISTTWMKSINFSQSYSALALAMSTCEKSGVLLTLPTSKDQFPNQPGHTEFFRSYYSKPELVMYFSSPHLQVLLLSDHLPVSALSGELTEDIIYARLCTALDTLKKWNWPTKRILISGLNPHAGEDGLIGYEDHRIKDAIKRLKKRYILDISGPFPGDTMLLNRIASDDILVYLFHDQGLGVFKGLQGFIGSNITLGLPYPRFSPDHGTSFGLYGKNMADYRGCEFSLKQALKLLKGNRDEKNSSYKSKST
jgi:4-hydroxythreonine-4-phosphate dehydrogenase